MVAVLTRPPKRPSPPTRSSWCCGRVRLLTRTGCAQRRLGPWPLPVTIDEVDRPLQFFYVPTIDLAGWNGASETPALAQLLAELAQRLGDGGPSARLPTTENSLVEDALRPAVSAQATEAPVLSPPESKLSSPSGRGRSMLAPTGFWSYTTSDDKNSRGKLSQLRALLAAELQQHIGRAPEVHIFQDVAAIAPG